ncbi:MAG: hypothetical protein M3Z22_04975 [Verrucomicrobiota bacterium]|nr:hypothetical protein [Verrucomicrobiota bacterium]
MYWNIGFIISGAIVLVVALLLIVILLVARNIRKLAAQALEVAGEIETATNPIFALGDANELMRETATAVHSVEQRIKAIGSRLMQPQ